MRLDYIRAGDLIVCSKCGRELPLEAFRVRRDSPGTRKAYTRSECRDCENADRRARRCGIPT
jgi:hypothetical protein